MLKIPRLSVPHLVTHSVMRRVCELPVSPKNPRVALGEGATIADRTYRNLYLQTNVLPWRKR